MKKRRKNKIRMRNVCNALLCNKSKSIEIFK